MVLVDGVFDLSLNDIHWVFRRLTALLDNDKVHEQPEHDRVQNQSNPRWTATGLGDLDAQGGRERVLDDLVRKWTRDHDEKQGQGDGRNGLRREHEV
jgi:hypothetical protein